MEKDLEQIFNKAKSVRLAEDEKTRMKEGLVSFMASKEILERKKDSGLNLWKVFKFRWNYALGVVMLLVFAGGGVSAAASNALPGDTLYPVKINVNEEIRGVFTFSEEAQIAWEEERVVRRLEEALKLSKAGRINPQLGEQIVRNFDKQANRTITRIRGFESRDREAVAQLISGFEVTLATHEDILESLTEIEGMGELEKLATSIREKAGDVSRARINAQEFLMEDFGLSELSEEVDVEAEKEIRERRKRAAEKMQASAVEKTEKLQEMLQRMEENGVVNEEKISETGEKVRVSKELIESGEIFQEEEKFSQAFFSFQEAFINSQTASLFLRAEATLNLNLLKPKDSDRTNLRDTDILPVVEISEFNEIDLENREEAIEKIRDILDRKLSEIELLIRGSDQPREVIIEVEAGILVAGDITSEALEKAEEDSLEESFTLFKQVYGVFLEIEKILKPESEKEVVEGGNESGEQTEKDREDEGQTEEQNKDMEKTENSEGNLTDPEL